MTATEHILLESDAREVPDRCGARKSHACVELRSRLRGRLLRLEIIDYYYLAVRTDGRGRNLEFSLDLRFVRAPRLSRHIAWRWIATALAVIATSATVATALHSLVPNWWRHEWLPVCLALAGASAVTTCVCLYRNTETLSLFSTYGTARLLEFTAGLGMLRRSRPFLAKLAAHIRLASSARRRTKAEHLRDEMREHLRLRELGVLSASDYELSKARILEHHGPGPR
jgi:hypothetical protein